MILELRAASILSTVTLAWYSLDDKPDFVANSEYSLRTRAADFPLETREPRCGFSVCNLGHSVSSARLSVPYEQRGSRAALVGAVKTPRALAWVFASFGCNGPDPNRTEQKELNSRSALLKYKERTLRRRVTLCTRAKQDKPDFVTNSESIRFSLGQLNFLSNPRAKVRLFGH